MSIQSDAAKAHIEKLLETAYPSEPYTAVFGEPYPKWVKEYRFNRERLWRFDYAVPVLLCAIEIDGGTFQGTRTGHSSGVGLRNWRDKNNAAMSQGWRVWHYAPEEIIKAGRKTLSDEPILLRLPWVGQ